MLHKRVFATAIFALLLNIACTSTQGTFEARLTDAPVVIGNITLTKLLVSVSDVSVHTSQSAAVNDAGWVAIRLTNATDVDLLTLQGGVNQLLGTTPLPSGHYQQLRITVASAKATYKDAQNVEHTTDVGIAGGVLKLNLDVTILDAGSFGFILDFTTDNLNTTTWQLTPTLKVKEVYVINSDGGHSPAPKGSGNDCNTGDTCAASNEKCCGATANVTGTCIDIDSDKNNCGDCGVVCSASQSCLVGGCS